MTFEGKEKYVCVQKDPRSTPLNKCVSLGDLMATIERCKKLDKEDDLLMRNNENRIKKNKTNSCTEFKKKVSS